MERETGSPTRSEFQRDRDRIIHSTAFRRLTHKTQVFIYHEGDHFRTRLTHTLEVSQIARALARSLGLDEDLAEAVALSHDLGHTPFGHTGEDALDAVMAPYGGFDHNVQAFRVVTRLERRYAAFDGLNLTVETLEGLLQHNGPLRDPSGAPLGRRPVPPLVVDFAAANGLDLTQFAPGEAQAAALADDIAYDAHDLDDGLRAGILDPEELRAVPLLDGLLDEIDAAHPGLERPRRMHELTRRVITRLVEGALAESAARIDALCPEAPDDIRGAGRAMVAFPAELAAADRAIKSVLFPKLYKHPRLMAVRKDADTLVRELFDRLLGDPGELPEGWRDGLDAADRTAQARRVADYIAGMTDRFAMEEHRRLLGRTPDLRIA